MKQEEITIAGNKFLKFTAQSKYDLYTLKSMFPDANEFSWAFRMVMGDFFRKGEYVFIVRADLAEAQR